MRLHTAHKNMRRRLKQLRPRKRVRIGQLLSISVQDASGEFRKIGTVDTGFSYGVQPYSRGRLEMITHTSITDRVVQKALGQVTIDRPEAPGSRMLTMMQHEMDAHLMLAEYIRLYMRPGEALRYGRGILRLFDIGLHPDGEYKDELDRMQCLMRAYTGGSCIVEDHPSLNCIEIRRI
jgi:hypothetical protein